MSGAAMREVTGEQGRKGLFFAAAAPVAELETKDAILRGESVEGAAPARRHIHDVAAPHRLAAPIAEALAPGHDQAGEDESECRHGDNTVQREAQHRDEEI